MSFKKLKNKYDKNNNFFLNEMTLCKKIFLKTLLFKIMSLDT